MLEFMREGGYAMWLILLLGLVDLGLAGWFAFRPGERKLAMLRPMSLATLFAILGGVTSGIAATMKHVVNTPEWAHSPDMPLIVMTGLGESMASAILGFGVLTVTWVLAAVGLRRQP